VALRGLQKGSKSNYVSEIVLIFTILGLSQVKDLMLIRNQDLNNQNVVINNNKKKKLRIYFQKLILFGRPYLLLFSLEAQRLVKLVHRALGPCVTNFFSLRP